MSEFGYRPDIKKAVNLTGITALKSQLRINILALGIPTIIEGQTCGKDVDLICAKKEDKLNLYLSHHATP